MVAAYLTPFIYLIVPHAFLLLMAATRHPLDDFLHPLDVDVSKIRSLARSLCHTFTRLAAESQDQFLPTPISESILRPSGDEEGRYGYRIYAFNLHHVIWIHYPFQIYGSSEFATKLLYLVLTTQQVSCHRHVSTYFGLRLSRT